MPAGVNAMLTMRADSVIRASLLRSGFVVRPLQQLRLGHELAEVHLALDLALDQPDALLELLHLVAELLDERRGVVPLPGARHLRVAELALQGGEQVEGVAATVGTGDLALLLAEQRRHGRLVVRVDPALLADVGLRAE